MMRLKLEDINVQELLETLKQKYPQGRQFCKIGILCRENPELEPQLRLDEFKCQPFHDFMFYP